MDYSSQDDDNKPLIPYKLNIIDGNSKINSNNTIDSDIVNTIYSNNILYSDNTNSNTNNSDIVNTIDTNNTINIIDSDNSNVIDNSNVNNIDTNNELYNIQTNINNINDDLDFIYKCIDNYEKNPRIKIYEENSCCSKCIIT